MGERGRTHLTTFGAVRIPEGPPSVDTARAALGGRAPSASGRCRVEEIGARVRFTTGGAEGVVVFASESERDVWIGEGRIRRASAAECAPIAEPARPDALTEIAGDARRFALLAEGDPVLYLDRLGRAHRGTLAEKCRYGALVATDDGRVLAVAFRRVLAR